MVDDVCLDRGEFLELVAGVNNQEGDVSVMTLEDMMWDSVDLLDFSHKIGVNFSRYFSGGSLTIPEGYDLVHHMYRQAGTRKNVEGIFGLVKNGQETLLKLTGDQLYQFYRLEREFRKPQALA